MSPRPGRSSTRRCRATEDRDPRGPSGPRGPPTPDTDLFYEPETMSNAEPLSSSAPQASRVSAAGRATFDIALRLGGLFVAILLVAFAFYCINSAFLNIDVIISVLRSMSSVAIMALGLTLVIVVGEIDLSFGAMYGLAANTLAVVWILWGVSVYVAIPIAIGVAILVGLFNGF